jgi:predicted XRE-type DNA-binding protein
MPSIKDLKRAEEAERLRAIRAIVDDVSQRIENQTLSETEARELVANVRFQVSLLIPEQMETYDLIYSTRFERLIQQFICGESGSPTE